MVLNYPNEWGGEDYLFILEKDDFITQQDKDKLFIYDGIIIFLITIVLLMTRNLE